MSTTQSPFERAIAGAKRSLSELEQISKGAKQREKDSYAKQDKESMDLLRSMLVEQGVPDSSIYDQPIDVSAFDGVQPGEYIKLHNERYVSSVRIETHGLICEASVDRRQGRAFLTIHQDEESYKNSHKGIKTYCFISDEKQAAILGHKPNDPTDVFGTSGPLLTSETLVDALADAIARYSPEEN